MNFSIPRQRILDFDIENRPLSYLGADWTTGEVTAIAWQFVGEDDYPTVVLLGREEPEEILLRFREAYDAADIVTGHYIRGHDLPVVNGALLEAGFQPLAPKLSSDTKLDLVKSKYQSLSQESLAAMLGVPADKVHMTQAMWREANRLTPEGLRHTEKRVSQDVIQHVRLRSELLALQWLGPPKVWDGGAKGSNYRP